MNRYSDYSVSVYDPMSFEDIARVPMMKRAQHDASQAKLDADLSEINKIDSLDVHTPEAMLIKSNLSAKINQQSEQLAREGFTNNTTPMLLKTNREIQDLFAPTGRAGQINAAKKVYIENRKDFLDDATKTKGWSMERALNAWTDFSSKNLYTGYDSGNNITNIGLLGAPKKIETLDKLKSVHDLLGEQVVGEMKASGYGFAAGPNGSTIMIDNSGRRIETSNKPNLQSALNLLDNQFNEKEWSDSRKFEGANSDSVKSQVINGVNSMLKTGIVDNRSENTQYIDAKESSGKPEDPDYEGVNVETVNVTKNSDLLKNLNGIYTYGVTESDISYGSSVAGLIPGYNSGTGDGNNQTKVITNALNSLEYLQLAKSIQRTQKINTTDLKSKLVQNAVKKYLENNKDNQIENRYTDPNTDKQAYLFASKELTGKDSKEHASDLIIERAQQGAYEVRNTDGEKILKDDLGKYKFTYSGDMTPKSQIKNKKGEPIFENPKQNIGARRGLLYDPETKKSFPVYVSRSNDDFKTPQYKGMKIINEITKITDSQPGIYHKIIVPDLKNTFDVKDFEVKYNKNSDTYNVSYTDNDGTYVDEQPMTSPIFQEYILNTQLHN